jgi:hypothetical protein
MSKAVFCIAQNTGQAEGIVNGLIAFEEAPAEDIASTGESSV